FVGQQGTRFELRVRSLEDGQETLLGTSQGYRGFFNPRWSRDGARLTYRRRQPGFETAETEVTGGIASIVLVNADGSNEQILAAPSQLIHYGPWDWSPDGQGIVASARPADSPTNALWLYPVSAAPHADAQRHLLASSRDHDVWGGRFSPDGRWVTFEAGGIYLISAALGIYLISVNGGEWRPIVQDGYWNEKPCW